jgi:hypothetical protein
MKETGQFLIISRHARSFTIVFTKIINLLRINIARPEISDHVARMINFS